VRESQRGGDALLVLLGLLVVKGGKGTLSERVKGDVTKVNIL
jgi:hypothetical protein